MPSKYQKKVVQKVKLQKISKKGSPQIRNSPNQPKPQAGILIFFIVCIVIGAGVVIRINLSNTPVTPTGDTPTGDTPADDSVNYQLTQTVAKISGEDLPLSNFVGKTLILYFTGADCIPCKMQLPFLIEAYNEYKSTGQVEVVSFDIQGKSIEELQQWVNDNSITWNVCQDTGMVMSSYFSIYSMPTLVICDTKGNEINRYIGAQDQATIDTIFENSIV